MHFIKILRERAGMTQRELVSGYHGVMTVPLLSLIERGIALPTPAFEKYALNVFVERGVQVDLERDKTSSIQFINAENRILPFIGEQRKHATRRRFLRAVSGMGDRAMRDGIAELRKEYPIVNFQDGRGYFLSEELEELQGFYDQEMNRVRSSLEGLRGVVKKIEELTEEQSDD